MREIVLDTETTGLDPKSGDRMVEIGCVEMVNHFPTGVTFHEYFNPDRDMPEAAFKVHGLSRDFLAKKSRFEDLAQKFLDFIDNDILIIHNAPFDMKFLNFELKRVNKPLLGMDRVIDTLAVARRKFPGAQNNLDALCRRFKIDNATRTLHGALLDSELLAEVYIELIGGRQAGLDLDNSRPAISGTSAANQRISTATLKREKPLPSRLTDTEKQAHEQFINTLGDDPAWRKYRS